MDFPFELKTHPDVTEVVSSILDIYPRETKQSFAKAVLESIGLREFKEKTKCICNKVLLIRANQLKDNFKDGTVCVYEVDVKWGNNDLDVVDKNSSNKYDFFREKDMPKAILICSTSTYVVDAKLAVYKHFGSDIQSGNIFLQHVFDEYDELSKICAHHTISSFSMKVKAMSESIPAANHDLLGILSSAAKIALSKENIKRLCHDAYIKDDGRPVGKVGSGSYTCRSGFRVRRLKEVLVKTTLEKIAESLTSEISKGILAHIEAKIQQELKNVFENLKISLSEESFAKINVVLISFIVELFDALMNVIMIVTTLIVTVLIPVDVNSRTWRNTVAEEIHKSIEKEETGILDKILLTILPICKETVSELKVVHGILEETKCDIDLVSQQEDVKEWEKREIMRDPSILKKYPSILNFIVGRKFNNPCVKVFLTFDDEEAKLFFKRSINTPAGTTVEFVNVTKYSDDMKKMKKDKKMAPTIHPVTRQLLSDILEKEEDKIYAKYSGLIAIDISSVLCAGSENRFEPCFALYCLDKNLIPFGEKPLPNQLENYRCDIREDIIQFGSGEDSQALNRSCSIGLPFRASAGSAGFLARSNSNSVFPDAGFLTAAHVVVEEFETLYEQQRKLSECGFFNHSHCVVHPSWKDSADSTVIGNVVDSFCGDYKSIGIDAAFVKVHQPRTGVQVLLNPASEHSICFNNYSEVQKYGRTTNKTTGVLKGKKYSCNVHSLKNRKLMRIFKNCYSVENKEDPFFLEGDSGSGVYLIDGSNKVLKPLGIAFSVLKIHGITAVCKIDTVLQALNVSLIEYQEMVVDDEMDVSVIQDEEMDTS